MKREGKEGEIKGKRGIGRVRERMRIKGIILMMMIVMGCNSGGVSEGKVNLEAKNSFLESLVAIGEGFQEIFVGFGSAIGDVLGFNVVKVGDKQSKVGEHFKKIGEGLTTTKNKLKELSSEISGAKNVEGSTIKVIEDVIKGTSDVFEKLITALTKLAGAVGSTEIGDIATGAQAVAANKDSVVAVIAEVNNIIDAAEKSGVNIEKGTAGSAVNASAATDATAVLAANAAAGAGAAAKLAGEISKADPWAIIDKIKNAKTKQGNLEQNENNDAGELATGTPNHANGAKAATNADLAAAVALKAMTKSGKLSTANNEADAAKAAAVSAVNKVLGILDVIIRKTVKSNLDKIREAVKGIKYSESSGIEASQSVVTK
ncbi:variable large family protein [Borrelia crocidurae]